MADASEQRKTLSDANSVGVLCAEIEGDIAALRAKYEQYFLGIERKPPAQEHASVKKKVVGLRNTFVRQVATKFRVEAVTSKLTTYERLWSRTLQEIEAGTYKRDLFKLKRKVQEKHEKPPEKPIEQKPVEQKAEAAAPKGAKPVAVAPAATSPGGAISDHQIKAIFDAYVLAKKRCNEDVSKISLATLTQTLRKQVPVLMKQHNAKNVEFKVVIKDGKAILRALPKDS